MSTPAITPENFADTIRDDIEAPPTDRNQFGPYVSRLRSGPTFHDEKKLQLDAYVEGARNS